MTGRRSGAWIGSGMGSQQRGRPGAGGPQREELGGAPSRAGLISNLPEGGSIVVRVVAATLLALMVGVTSGCGGNTSTAGSPASTGASVLSPSPSHTASAPPPGPVKIRVRRTFYPAASHRPPTGSFTATGLGPDCMSGTLSDQPVTNLPHGIVLDSSFICHGSQLGFIVRSQVHFSECKSDGSATDTTRWQVTTADNAMHARGTGRGKSTGCSPVGSLRYSLKHGVETYTGRTR